MILQLFFTRDVWNMVPQYLTDIGMFPDIAFERFRTGSDNTKRFVPTVWVEFKSYVNMTPKAAIRQLLESIEVKHGRKVSKWGYLIGVQGRKWSFMEYNLSYNKDYSEYTIIPYAFLAPNLQSNPDIKGRPQSNISPYREADFYTGKVWS